MRIKRASVLVGVIILTVLVNQLFFKNMEFINSKVYPDLYLVKYPIKDKGSIHSLIEEMVSQKLKNQFKTSSKNRIATLPYRIRFYEYNTGTPFSVPFGEAGTKHFIENKEDPGGFSNEELSHYSQYRIAEFSLDYCQNDTMSFVGRLSYYQGWDVIKTDITINQCKQPRLEDEEQVDLVSDIY